MNLFTIYEQTNKSHGFLLCSVKGLPQAASGGLWKGSGKVGRR